MIVGSVRFCSTPICGATPEFGWTSWAHAAGCSIQVQLVWAPAGAGIPAAKNVTAASKPAIAKTKRRV